MKIAIPYENGQVFQHFGHSAQFKIYDTENGKILSSEIVSTNGQGHGALVGFLVQNGVNVVLCGGIGAGAQNALAQAGIQLFGAFLAMQIQLCLTICPVILSLTPMRTATITAMRRGTPAALIPAMRTRVVVPEIVTNTFLISVLLPRENRLHRL